MAGRKPKSNIVKLKTGNPGGRPLKNTLGSTGSKPKQPEHLSEGARAIWDEIVEYLSSRMLLDRVDAVWIEIFANAYARKRDAEKVVAAEGTTYTTETDNGVMHRIRPEVGIIERAEKQISRMLNDAAMTPASRERMGDPSQRNLPFDNEFNDV